nr:hypothetical protein [Streptomyces sp. RS2]
MSSGRTGFPSSPMAMMSSRVVSTCTSSPGRSATTGVNGRTGTAVAVRAGRPGCSSGSDRTRTSRLNVDGAGSATVPGPWTSARICPVTSRSPFRVPVERPRWRRSASSTAATTRSSARPVALDGLRWRTRPMTPPVW